MEKDLIKFNSNLTEVYKDILKYEDEQGNVTLLNAGSLLCKCENLRPDEQNHKKMIYDGEVDKEMEFEKTTVTVQVPKSAITGNKEDFTTIVDQDVEVFQMWKVSNGLGLTKVFNKKDEAIELVGEINERFINLIKVM